ncbi:MAG TPA: hypothetical protein VLT62_17925, partial [Candidatus Methylomirabilis sp.]|nr:hypothetical protein [Candidatus Methylomirabilis sp.]
MGRVRVALACTACCVFLLAWAIAGLHPRPIAAPLQEAAPAACPDPMAIVKAFYDANDASRFDRSLGFLTEDATLSTWAEGVNGYHARARHFAGK